MGVIWLQTTTGKLIHLPIIGDDINSSSDAIKIPTSFLKNSNRINRSLTGVFTIIHPTYGDITFDFTVSNRVGTCNQCGLCCVHPVENCPMSLNNCGYIFDSQYNVHKCKHLVINSGSSKLGKAGQTSCSIYEDLIDGSKGCLFGPQVLEDIWTWMTSCGYKFG